METQLLTTGEIAKLCRVTYRCVLKWIEDGKLKAYTTPGRHHRVKVNDFLKFLQEYNMPVPDKFRGIEEKKRILIVDDDKNMVRAIERAIGAEKQYEIDVAYNGFDAGQKLFSFKPDLIVLDIRMPGMDGYEVAKRIKQSPETKDMRIIAISAFFRQDGKEKILSLGAEVCLDKPFKTEVLLRKVKEMI